MKNGLFKRIALCGALLTSTAASAFTLDFFDTTDFLVGSVRFSNTELGENGEWSITPSTLTGGTNVYSESGVVDMYVTLYDSSGDPTFVGSTWSSAIATDTIYGTLSDGIGGQAQGGAITVADDYFLYPYDENGNPIFNNGLATVSPLNFVFSSVAGDDVFNIRDLDINLSGDFVVRDAPLIATPIPAAVLMFAPALLGFFGFRRKMQG